MGTTAVKNPLDPRVVRTRRLIIDAFASLLAEKEFDAITVQDIASRATVNRATFYSHFDDKYDLVDKMTVERFRKQLTEQAPRTAALDRSSLEALGRTVDSFLDALFGHCRLDRHLSSMIESAMHDTLCDYIADWVGTSETPGIDGDSADVIAVVVSSALIGSHLAQMRRSSIGAASKATVRTVDLLADGIFGWVLRPGATAPKLQPRMR